MAGIVLDTHAKHNLYYPVSGDSAVERALPSVLPKYVMDVAVPYLTRRKLLFSKRKSMSNALKPKETHEIFASLGGDASAPPVVNIAPTHEMPIGSTGAIVTLPTLGDLSGQAKKILEPLRLYPCVTESPLTKGRNYQTHIIPLDKKLRIPLENIVFSSVELTEEKIKKAELLIHKHQLAYQAEVDDTDIGPDTLYALRIPQRISIVVTLCEKQRIWRT